MGVYKTLCASALVGGVCAGLIGLLLHHLLEHSANIVVMIVTFLFVGTLRFFRFKNETKCPGCGKSFAMKETSRQVLDTEVTAVKKIQKTGMHTYYTQCVPVTKYYCGCIERCKYCSYEQRVYRTKTREN